MILYQFNRAKQLQFACKLNQLLNNSGCEGFRLDSGDLSTEEPVECTKTRSSNGDREFIAVIPYKPIQLDKLVPAFVTLEAMFIL